MPGEIDFKIDYPKVEKMSSLCNEAAEELSQTIATLKKIAHTLREGGLQGKAGSVTADAISGTLVNKLFELQDKMREIHQDINRAIENSRSTTEVIKGRFG